VRDGNPSWNEAGLEDFLGRYTPALRRLAFSYTRNPQESEDLFQEIAIALWKALPKFRGDSTERTYVYRVAHNTAMRFVTSRHRRISREQTTDEHMVEPASADNPEQDAIRNQRRQQLWNAVGELPMIDRQIVLLHMEGLSTAEIVDITGSTEGMVAMRLSRIRRRLVLQLNQANKEEPR